MPEPIAPYYERLPDLDRELTERGSLGLLVLDASLLRSIEDRYGLQAYEEVRQRMLTIIEDARGKDYRAGDILCLERPRGLRFLFLLERKRRRNVPLSVADLRAARARVMSSLVPSIARAAFPYIKPGDRCDRPEVGHGLAVFNPLLHPARMVERAFEDALAQAAHQRRSDELLVLERLQDVLLRERVVTAYQRIFRMKDDTILGAEALSRGPRGSGLDTADALFGAARSHGLEVELDRLCRRRALLASVGRVPSSAKIFVNTLPATMRDPQFRGKALIDFLDRAQVSPDRIVIEITEKLMIENYALFRETMADFTQLGMSFAVDDVGAGYSGLESIHKLKPSYIKIDMGLVQDVHVSTVNRAMAKAIITLGHRIGAEVIAEGIQSEEELQVLRALGVDFGQGYHLARPDTDQG
ncbi:MAG: EAL domain-containing protein [Acidobacteria bacterium]|jgi:EAL domain-containing protein (putative c-di-GMP-specific phosphodiesterase class I)|nr:EAL domain-containing protein [Acidobacteriota bacterium]